MVMISDYYFFSDILCETSWLEYFLFNLFLVLVETKVARLATAFIAKFWIHTRKCKRYFLIYLFKDRHFLTSKFDSLPSRNFIGCRSCSSNPIETLHHTALWDIRFSKISIPYFFQQCDSPLSASSLDVEVVCSLDPKSLSPKIIKMGEYNGSYSSRIVSTFTSEPRL